MTKALLIGLDGATFTILDPLMERGVMPFLRDFVSHGVRATLRSVRPPLTPPAWTSLMTGKLPGQHGVFDFFQKEEPQSVYFRFATSQDIGSPTIWTLASDQGRRVSALNFPLMFPPPNVNGCVVPGGWMPWRALRLGCHPAGLFDRLKTLPTFDAKELAMEMASEQKAVEGCSQEEYADWIALHIRREQRWFEVAHYLIDEEPADLVGVLFDGIDRLQHLVWRFLDPACQSATPSSWEQEITRLCEAYFNQIDTMVADLVARVGPEATVVMASDHGFGPAVDVFYLNAWLEQHGYLAWADSVHESEAQSRLGFGDIARHVSQLDWQRTVAYAATPSSHGIHIVGGAPGSEHQMSPERYRAVREELVQTLREAQHPISGRPLVAEVATRDEVFAGRYEALAPDIYLRLAEGGAISILPSETTMRQRPEPAGNHRPEGIFLAGGPGIRRGEKLDDLSIVDVAPLLLHALDLPIPDDMAGRLPAAAFEPGVLQDRQPRLVASRPMTQTQEAPAGDFEFDPESEETILKRLRALGYVD